MKPLALVKSDAKYLVKTAVGRLRGRPEPRLSSRVPIPAIKQMIAKRGFALAEGEPSWFYTAYYRSDPLTMHTLDWVVANIPKDAAILNTGCGTGIMLFWLLDHGFSTVDGFDYLADCVEVANEIKKMGGYSTRIWQDDGFRPVGITRKYDLVTAMHWVFSAWMGNYGNSPAHDAKDPATRERLLSELLGQYVPHLNPGGRIVVELTDATADYRVPNDHPYLSLPLDSIYPVRHTPEQVRRCAAQLGMQVIGQNMSITHGHQPRTSYTLSL